MALSFSKPAFTKVVSQPTGIAEPCYTFLITTSETLSGLFEAEEEPAPTPVEYLTRRILLDNSSWFNTLLTEFMKSSAKYFTKPYTAELIQSRLTHVAQGVTSLTTCSHVVYTPVSLAIFQGMFTLTWSVTQEAGFISIPDVTAGPVQKVGAASPADLWVKTPHKFTNARASNEVIDDIPLSDSPDVISLVQEGRTPEAILDKRRVQEATLRAKLALLKAERTHAEYVQKYGEEASDESEFEDSESEEEG